MRDRMDTPQRQNHVEFDEPSLEDMVEFADNPEPRCPCVLLLDTSYSMKGAPIGALNEGVRTFKSELEKDNLASLRVEVAVIAFGAGPIGSADVKVVQDFATVDKFDPPKLSVGSATPMAAGIQKALDHIEDRKQRYRESGIGYYRPWVFMITDGAPTDDADTIEAAFQRLADEERDKRVAFFAVGVEGADMEFLRQRIPRAPLPLKGLAFRELFVWLSASMSQVSRSRTNDEVRLDTDTLKGWAAI